MKNGKRLMYLIAGVAYINSLWERLRTKTTLISDAFDMSELDKVDDCAKPVIRSAAIFITFVLLLMVWPFVLVIDLTTKWDESTKRTVKVEEVKSKSTRKAKK